MDAWVASPLPKNPVQVYEWLTTRVWLWRWGIHAVNTTMSFRFILGLFSHCVCGSLNTAVSFVGVISHFSYIKTLLLLWIYLGKLGLWYRTRLKIWCQAQKPEQATADAFHGTRACAPVIRLRWDWSLNSILSFLASSSSESILSLIRCLLWVQILVDWTWERNVWNHSAWRCAMSEDTEVVCL